MAITKIHAIKSTVQAAVDYITDPDKTDGRILVDTYCCGIESAAYDFQMANSMSERNDCKNLAFHLIQSFTPGEVSFEEAHQVGIELADSLLDNKFSYVLATHINREHIHNHIIFCATDNDEHKRYYDNKKTYCHIRELSDGICKEHGLSVIVPGIEKGKSYIEWQADRKNESHKYILRKDILDSIRIAKSYDDFLEKMIQKGYAIKGAELGEDAPMYLSFRPPNYGNYIRASYKNLGKGYTKEEIVVRINRQIESRQAWIEKQKNLPNYERNLIDTSSAKFQENEGLKNWAETENMIIAAATYAKVGSVYELEKNIELLKDKSRATRSEIVAIDKELKVIREQIRYRENYDKYKPFHDKYISMKNKEDYYECSESELILFDGAKRILKEYGINPKETSLKDLQDKFNQLTDKRTELKSIYETSNEEIKESERKLDTLNKYFHLDNDHDKERSKKHERGR